MFRVSQELMQRTVGLDDVEGMVDVGQAERCLLEHDTELALALAQGLFELFAFGHICHGAQQTDGIFLRIAQGFAGIFNSVHTTVRPDDAAFHMKGRSSALDAVRDRVI